MKIRTRLRLNTWVSLGALMLMMLFLAWSNWEIYRTDQNENLVAAMRKTAFERISLQDDYLLHREDRAKVQWLAKSEALRRLLTVALDKFNAEEDKSLLKETSENFHATFSVFAILLEKHTQEKRTAMKKFEFSETELRMISQVFLKTYALQDSIDRLYESTEKKVITARNRELVLIAFFIISGVIAIVINSSLLNRIVAKRLTALNEGVRTIGDGNLNHRFDQDGNDELADLARAGNAMASRLRESYISVENLQQEVAERKQAEGALRISEAFLNAVVENSPHPLWVSDDTGKLIHINRACCDLLNIIPEEVIGKYHVLHDSIVEEQGLLPLVSRVFLNGEQVHFEITYDSSQLKNLELQKKAFAILDTTISPIKDMQGKLTNAIIQHVDITLRKQAEEEIRLLNAELEQRVEARTTQMEATNRELEAFSYSVSHDLRAPLRSIDGFSQAVIEEYGDKLDATGLDYLQRVRKATQRMGFLIDDLLKLSRVTRFDLHDESVDLSRIIQEIIENIRKSDPGRTIDIVIQTGVTIHGDRYLLQIALQNLLDNAWKFTSREAQPKIEFGQAIINSKTVYFIRDNGVGFDMAYVDKLFGAFQRLQSSSDFPGTGIGLATVQRIIHRHGGRVWAEGTVGKGATFYFTLT